MVGSGTCGRRTPDTAMPRLVIAVLVQEVSLLVEGFGPKLVADAQGVMRGDVLAPHVNGLPGLEAERCTQLLDAPEQLDCLGLCQHD